MSTLSSVNVTDVNLVLKERAHKIKMTYSMHRYSNSYAYFRQLPNLFSLYLMNFMLHTMLDVLRVHYKSMKYDVLFSQVSVRTIFRRGGHFSYMTKKCLPLYISAKIIKIDRDFPTLWSQMYFHLFMVHMQCRSHTHPIVDNFQLLKVFSERELKFMFAICRRPSVCLSSVCNVRAPYTGDWNFRNFFFTIWYAGHLLTSE